MNTKSATIQIITSLSEIPNADRIELAGVLGWKCVVSKSDGFKVGDKVIYIEIDSVVPELPEFEFLRQRNFRVRTMKLRGVVSQGLILPMKFLEGKIVTNSGSILPISFITENSNLGDDVSEYLGVTHYEKPIPATMKGQVAGSFPTHLVSITDEIRIQSVPDAIQELIDAGEVYISTKCDGTSFTVTSHEGVLNICSRKLILKDNEENAENTYIKMFRKYDIEKKLRYIKSLYTVFPLIYNNLAIQGEICGPGIQGNNMGLKDFQLFLFNVYDIDNRRYLDFPEFMKFAEVIEVPTVPILEVTRLSRTTTQEDLLKLARGNYEGTKHPREGIVIRPITERYSHALKGRLSVKIINPDYKED